MINVHNIITVTEDTQNNLLRHLRIYNEARRSTIADTAVQTIEAKRS